ncbi:hypothetical protein [Cohaesibacter gelatinilyticus]|uniref:Uncharacterized protein n=1 Tax=Cohaesibacter gelatinilyticus TaxID=372072 RepID=A0A285PNL1_9HYPH|nr:hypothetical protein [Cohaesibacter gelatinilyticus]SNZ21716.1 hypothetical protein SAMN06265368_4841 [Cohaesibacter gelatinilyticus]
MKVIVTKPFPGVRDGETKVTQFAVGDELTGELASVALAEKWAIEEKKPRSQAKKGK